LSPPRPPSHFVTARLTARPPRVEDAPAVFAAYASSPAVTRYLSWRAYADPAALADFLCGQMHDWEDGKSTLAWLLCLPSSGEPIGSIGVTVEGGKALFGYVLGERWWGQGLTAEALAWLVDWALGQPEIFRAWAFCDTENFRSARVLEKSGMSYEGTLRRWHTCPTLGPELRDCRAYAKVK
jgi:ribosomal-protein-alanine N-acetyltransferase